MKRFNVPFSDPFASALSDVAFLQSSVCRLSGVLGVTIRRAPRRFAYQRRRFASNTPNTSPTSKQKYIPDSGSYPQGFQVSGIHVGVKPSNKDKPDLALITSDRPSSAAAVFTKNKFPAAPVLVSRKVLSSGHGDSIRGIVVNAGCANAVTGQGGINDAWKMTEAMESCGDVAAERSAPNSTLVMSTGVIGQRLPITKILDGIPVAFARRDSSHESWLAAARAICTTDTFPKLVSTSYTLPSDPATTYRLAGITKGAGMIHPNMATLLGIVCTDVKVEHKVLHELLTFATKRSFNSISVDGDTSTNDTVALLANGAAGGSVDFSHAATDDAIAFRDVLTSFMQSLSQLVVRDGEGATKFVRIRVTGADSYLGAETVASMIARSPLVKTALYGRDANWGRILMAAGNAQGPDMCSIIPEKTSVHFVPSDGSEVLHLLTSGEPQQVDETRAKQILENEDLEIVLDLGTGTEEASYWFSDLSHEYVTINGDYRT